MFANFIADDNNNATKKKKDSMNGTSNNNNNDQIHGYGYRIQLIQRMISQIKWQ